MASHNNILQPQITYGRNYHHWSIQMKVLFESLDLWRIVEDGFNESQNQDTPTLQQMTELRDARKKDKKALLYIYQTVEDPIFERISRSNTSKDAWEILYKTYRGEDRVKNIRLQTLRREFDNLRMKESEAVEEFYNRVIGLVNQMRLNGEEVQDQRIIEKILRSMSQKFEYIVVAIEESKDLASLSLENLLGILQSHELRIRNFDSPMEQAFHSRVHVKGDPKDNGEGSSKERSQPRPLYKIQCYYCHKFGHTLKYCKKKQKDESDDANFLKENESKETGNIFMNFEIDELVNNEIWKDLTAKDDLIVTDDKAIAEDLIGKEDCLIEDFKTLRSKIIYD